MQKISIAIVLALTLSCVVAVDYTVTTAGWVKPPVSICNDTEYACTNSSAVQLVGLMSNDVTLAAYNASVPVDAKNTSSASWSVFTRTIASKDLSASSNATYAYKGGQFSSIAYGIAVAITMSNESTSNPQLYLYQTKVNGAVEYPRVQITNNTNVSYTPSQVGLAFSSKTIFIFYLIADKKVNATSVALAASAIGKEVTVSSAYTASFGAATGEAISTNQVYAGWLEGETTYKVAIVDFSSAALVNSATLGKFEKGFSCSPYSTDKKYYGVVCTNQTGSTSDNTTVYVSANSTDLLTLFTTNHTVRRYDAFEAYGPYLAFFYTVPTPKNASVLSYDIWDVEGFKSFKADTPYLTVDQATTVSTRYRIPQGGLYVVAYNMNVTAVAQPNYKVVVGLLMGASYLTSVFGFLLTIIAGLFLF